MARRDGNPTFPAMRGVVVTGNVTREVYYSDKGETSFAGLNLALNSRLRSDSEDTDVLFVKVNLFGNMADWAEAELDVGSRITLQGDLYVETYETKDGDEGTNLVVQNVQSAGLDVRWYGSKGSKKSSRRNDDDVDEDYEDEDDRPQRGRRSSRSDDDSPRRGRSTSRRSSRDDDDDVEDEAPRRRSTRSSGRRSRVSDYGDE